MPVRLSYGSVSYTHLDVYKRQIFAGAAGATEAAERIRREHAGWFVEATHTMASGEFEDEQD